jgi:protein transport protein SEC24
MSEVFAGADQAALATLFANKAVERALSHKLEDARDALAGKTAEILGAYKASMTAGGAGASAQLAVADNLRMLPVLMLALLKTVRGVRGRAMVAADSVCRSASARARRSRRTSARTRRRS